MLLDSDEMNIYELMFSFCYKVLLEKLQLSKPKIIFKEGANAAHQVLAEAQRRPVTCMRLFGGVPPSTRFLLLHVPHSRNVFEMFILCPQSRFVDNGGRQNNAVRHG